MEYVAKNIGDTGDVVTESSSTIFWVVIIGIVIFVGVVIVIVFQKKAGERQ